MASTAPIHERRTGRKPTMTDDNDTSGDENENDETARHAREGITAATKAVGAIIDAANGDATEAISGAAGAAGGVADLVDGEAGGAVETGATVVGAASDLAEATRGLSEGDAGRGAESVGSAAGTSRYLVSNDQASEALRRVFLCSEVPGASCCLSARGCGPSRRRHRPAPAPAPPRPRVALALGAGVGCASVAAAPWLAGALG